MLGLWRLTIMASTYHHLPCFHAARFLGNGTANRIDFIAESEPRQVVPFAVLPQFAYLQAPDRLR